MSEDLEESIEISAAEYLELLEKAEGSGRTNEALWSRSKSRAKAKLGGKWSARAAQLAGKYYRDAGGKYSGAKSEGQKSLSKWTSEKWQSADGKKADRKGGMHRYLPKAAWEKLSPAQKKATDRKKVEGGKGGRQFVPNTESAAKASREIRKAEGGDLEKSVGTTSAASARVSTKRYAESSAGRLRMKAKWAVQAALRSGKLKKPSSCSKCGKTGVKLMFHHTDTSYAEKNWLKGVWVDSACHSKIDPQRHGPAARKSAKKRRPTNT